MWAAVRDQRQLEVRELYDSKARGLFKLAVVLVGDAESAEDIVQEAFLAYFRARPGPKPGSELAYLRRTVVNLAHGHHRRRYRRQVLRGDTALESPSAESEVSDAHRLARVVAEVRSLPERQRDAVVLHYFSGLSGTEIASVLAISPGSVKTHLHRARVTLAQRLEELNDGRR